MLAFFHRQRLLIKSQCLDTKDSALLFSCGATGGGTLLPFPCPPSVEKARREQKTWSEIWKSKSEHYYGSRAKRCWNTHILSPDFSILSSWLSTHFLPLNWSMGNWMKVNSCQLSNSISLIAIFNLLGEMLSVLPLITTGSGFLLVFYILFCILFYISPSR